MDPIVTALHYILLDDLAYEVVVVVILFPTEYKQYISNNTKTT